MILLKISRSFFMKRFHTYFLKIQKKKYVNTRCISELCFDNSRGITRIVTRAHCGQLQMTNLVFLDRLSNGSKQILILLTGFRLTRFSCFMIALINPPDRAKDPEKGIDISICRNVSHKILRERHTRTARDVTARNLVAPMLPPEPPPVGWQPGSPWHH